MRMMKAVGAGLVVWAGWSLLEEAQNRKMLNSITGDRSCWYKPGDWIVERQAYLWPDGSERPEPVPSELLPRQGLADRFVDWLSTVI